MSENDAAPQPSGPGSHGEQKPAFGAQGAAAQEPSAAVSPSAPAGESPAAAPSAPAGESPETAPSAATGEPSAGSGQQPPSGQASHRASRVPAALRSGWSAIAVACLVAGIAAAVLGAHALSSRRATNARSAFHNASAQVASHLNLALAQQEELVVSASTFFAANPNASRGRFDAWARWAQPLRRYPQLDRMALVALLPVMETVVEPVSPAAALRTGSAASAPTARAGSSLPASGSVASAAGSLATAGSPATSGSRVRTVASKTRFHCFAIAGLSRSGAFSSHADYCAHSHSLLALRDSGKSRYARASTPAGATLLLDTPVYRGGVPPSTLAQRREAFVGWLREVLLPEVVLAQAIQDEPTASAVRLWHGDRRSKVLFGSGTPQPGAQTAAVSLHGGWNGEVFGAPVPGGFISGAGPLALALGGILFSALLAAALLLLGERRRLPRAPTPREDAQEDLYDPLTGVPNRALTLDRAERMLARAGRHSGILVGALFVDIDWLRDVNEKLGKEAGDQLIKTVAERLQGSMRAQDTVGRLGGDEFVMLIETAGGARLDRIARRVIEALHKPVELPDFGPSFYLSASIGVAMGRYATPQDLLRDAQLALEASKAAGKDRFTIFNANMRSVIEGRGLLEADLNNALLERQFFLHFQPVFDLQSGRPAGFEALIRWLHPKQGVREPGEFLGLAEETGLIIPMGRWVLEEACSQAAAWNVAGHPMGVSVNISARQLHRDGFATDVLRALQLSGLDASMLTLEIAESAVMADLDAAAARLTEIKRLGVRVAIDDFGSGYAYRTELERMNLDMLKVDPSSLAAAEDEDYRSWLLEAIMILGRDLGLTVVAKHVEDAAQLERLKGVGAMLAQGYLLGKPAPAGSLESLMSSEPAGWDSSLTQRD